MTEPVPIFIDEWQPTAAERLSFYRMRMRLTFVRSWAIGEKFDERFDTEVGGTQLLVTQGIDAAGNVYGGLKTSMTVDEFAAVPKVGRPSAIVDYDNGGKPISPEEAEGLPELAAVLARLREREAAYHALFKND